VVDGGATIAVRLAGWRLAGDLQLPEPLGAFDAWNELWIGACAAHDRFLALETRRAVQGGGWDIEWRVTSRAGL
jgi:hypothetical protein